MRIVCFSLAPRSGRLNSPSMPGHEKKGSSDGQDPDPTPYLFLTFEMKREDMSKAYDAKKSYWVPDGDGGFVEGLLESENGGKAQVSIGHDKKVFKREQIQQVFLFLCFSPQK